VVGWLHLAYRGSNPIFNILVSHKKTDSTCLLKNKCMYVFINICFCVLRKKKKASREHGQREHEGPERDTL
jgi:hypothetical protein